MNSKVKKLLTDNKIKLVGVTGDKYKKYWLKVGEYEVRLWSEMINKNIIYKWNCTCIRGSLINPTHNTYCSHVLAAQVWLTNKFIGETNENKNNRKH